MPTPVYISNVKNPPLAAASVIGRVEELRRIADALETGDDLLLLNGMGGVGKTTLAGFYMARYASRYQHIAWISCSGDFRGDLVRQLQRQRIPGLPDTDNVPELFAAMLLRMEEMPGPNLLIADNLNTPAQVDDLAAHKRHFPANWKMLITSRCNTGAFSEHLIGVLDEAEARELFARHYTFRPDDTEAQRDELLRKLGRHTLAVEFIAKTLAQLPSWNLARMLRHLEEKGLAELGAAATVSTAHSQDQRVLMEEYLRAIFEINLGAIGEISRALLAVIALFPAQPHPFRLLCQVLGCDEEKAQDRLGNTLNTLKINGLLEDLGAGGWYLHPLLQAVARQKWPAQYETLEPLLTRLENALDKWPLPDSAQLIPFAASLAERLQFGDTRLAGFCWSISDRYRDIGDFPNSERFMREANRMYVERDDKRNIGVTFQRLGDLAESQGDFTQAFACFERYNQICEEVCNNAPDSEDLKNLLAISYERLGSLLKAQGKIEEALGYFEKYKNLHEELSKANPKSEALKNGLAISYGKIGELLQTQGKMEEALGYFEKYNRFHEELCEANPKSEEWKNNLATSYEKMGSLLQKQGKMDEALRYFEKYNKLREDLYLVNPYSERLKKGLAISYERLGDLLKAQGKMDEALRYFEQELALFKELNASNQYSQTLGIGLGVSYIRLAGWHKAQKNTGPALEYYRKGLALYEKWHAITGRPDVGEWIENVRKSIAALEQT